MWLVVDFSGRKPDFNTGVGHMGFLAVYSTVRIKTTENRKIFAGFFKFRAQ
jgi:hypothetical protein